MTAPPESASLDQPETSLRSRLSGRTVRTVAGLFVSDLVIRVAVAISFAVVSRRFGDLQYANYQLLRSAGSFLLAVVGLGSGVLLSRQLAQSPDLRLSLRYLRRSMLAFGAFIVLAVAGEELGHLWSRNVSLSLGAVAAYALGLVLLDHTTAYYWGLSGFARMQAALVFVSVVPLVAAGLAPNAATFSWLLPGIMLGGGLLSLMSIYRTYPTSPASVVRPTPPGARTLNDICMTALITVPPFVAASFNKVDAAGVATGLSAIVLWGSLTVPVSRVMLPFATKMLASGRPEALRRLSLLLAASAALPGLLASAAIWFFGAQLAARVLKLDQDQVRHIQLIGLACPGYGVYGIVRSSLDADRPSAALAVSGSALGVYLAAALFAWQLTSIQAVRFLDVALAVALTVLGGGTLLLAIKRPSTGRSELPPNDLLG